MLLSNPIISRERKYLEGNISGLETQKDTIDTQAEELRNQVAEMEEQNGSLDTMLKATNENKIDITPLREHALLLRRKIYQVQ